MTFIKLTPLKEGAPQVLVNPAFIVCIGQTVDRTVITLANADELVPVRESPAEILALLAEPQPVAVTVTDAMVEAALDAYDRYPDGHSQSMRAALEAALAVRAEK